MVASDAIGSGFAPDIFIKGVLQAAMNKSFVLLLSPQEIIATYLDSLNINWRDLSISLADTPKFIRMDEYLTFYVLKEKKSFIARFLMSINKNQCKSIMLRFYKDFSLAKKSFFALNRLDLNIIRNAIKFAFKLSRA